MIYMTSYNILSWVMMNMFKMLAIHPAKFGPAWMNAIMARCFNTLPV